MMNIFTAVNNLYYPQLKILLHTLKKHNSEPITLSLLYFDLSEKNRSNFAEYTKRLGINLRMIQADPLRVKGYKIIKHVTVETYFRFMLLDIYPDEERALWMDVDTVVLGDISSFYYADFEENYVIGTPEAKENLDKKRLKLDHNGTYFNAGVVLYNLAKIRQNFSPDFLYRLYEHNEASVRFADQDILNIAFSHKTKRDESGKYNYMVRSGTPISRQEIKRIKKEVTVVHFIRNIKPWHYDYQGKVRWIYLRAMFSLYPVKSILLAVGGEIFTLKKNKNSL